MAWRPTTFLIEGELDNSTSGRITGWMHFLGMHEVVRFNLTGNFHRDIRGARIRLRGEGESADKFAAEKYLAGFTKLQQGKVGDMTAGREPCDYGVPGCGYFEWYSDDNGRVVIELSTDQVELLSPPIPACESEPISRKEQAEHMARYLTDMATSLGIPQQNAITVGNTAAVETARQVVANDQMRGMKLLPPEIRELLPPLETSIDPGGKALVPVKFFTPDANWTWFAVQGSPVENKQGSEIDFEFFGLVEGLEKEMGLLPAQ